jgi:hypothetical protein
LLASGVGGGKQPFNIVCAAAASLLVPYVCLFTYDPTCLPPGLPACLPAPRSPRLQELIPGLAAYTFAALPACLPTCLRTCLPACLPACSNTTSRLQELIPELTAAVEKVGFTWKDFTVTDNSCKPHPPPKGLVQVGISANVATLLQPFVQALCCCAQHGVCWHV